VSEQKNLKLSNHLSVQQFQLISINS